MAVRIAKEIELKQQIINKLKEINEIKIRAGASCSSEDFMRGFIFGASTAKEIEIPPHWYDEMMNEAKKPCEGGHG